MNKLALKKLAFLKKNRNESILKYFETRRKQIQSPVTCSPDIPEYDFEFSNQVVSYIEGVVKVFKEDFDYTCLIELLSTFKEFILSNFEALEANADVLLGKIDWNGLFKQTLPVNIFTNEILHQLSEIFLVFCYSSERIWDAITKEDMSVFLGQMSPFQMESVIFKNLIEILILTAQNNEQATFKCLQNIFESNLVDVSEQFLSTLKIDFETIENLLGILEGFLQVPEYLQKDPFLTHFLVKLMCLDFPDDQFAKNIQLLLFCWESQNGLIENFQNCFVVKKIINFISNSKNEFLLTSCFSLLGNWLAYKSKWSLRDASILNYEDLNKLLNDSLNFLELSSQKFTAQEKCLFMARNLVLTFNSKQVRKNYVRIFEILAHKISKFGLLKKTAALEELLLLAKAIFERAKIEEQMEISTQSLDFLRGLFELIGFEKNGEVLLLTIHNIITYLNTDKIIYQKIKFNPAKEFILDNNLLGKVYLCEKNVDNRVRNLAQFVVREYFQNDEEMEASVNKERVAGDVVLGEIGAGEEGGIANEEE